VVMIVSCIVHWAIYVRSTICSIGCVSVGGAVDRDLRGSEQDLEGEQEKQDPRR